MLQSTKYQESTRILEDVQQRQSEILNLSQTIIQLQQLFQDMSAIVKEQDALVNSVYDQVIESCFFSIYIFLYKYISHARSNFYYY